ncbi:hypothetical protein G6675_09255 [Polynucleobacter paneuropaeus]|jgi:hypothetical protein|uniref:hypothetical protein n=1 Tax=Polynucleobacter nymphae TaxID=2081043 RepID=UPI001BFDECC4|nr:hypothetical protein [Polynucleobacter nymphae]MBT8588463.1 hypothetical protein [Polynucleobacter paneuropaeus]MBT8601131.1 hypothetical protein [Polynucleobacter paneuropaeus]MBU3608905.1 hypothetical protein [Polynucleobacter nymphae]
MKPIRPLLVLCLFLLAIPCSAEKLASQNWVVDVNGQTNEAYTANDSQSSFGVFCSGEKCLFYLHQALKCDPGTKYSVLMNSQTISTALSMECTLIGGNLFQILDPFEAVLKATQAGEMIGFAVALQSGAFAVNRFSLIGAKPAIERALLEAAKSKFREQKPPVENVPKSTFKDIKI